mmetsp:Transcript_63778/g.74699  ORF Transcript_63778/g.74699 Transcript_63778/m.74699 type:complete len:116 (+) Transcript_63778:1482-1829(+)
MFIGGNISNSDMWDSFCFNVYPDSKSLDGIPLQTNILCIIAFMLTSYACKNWYTRHNLDSQHHIPFAMLTICHQIKLKFAQYADDINVKNDWEDGICVQNDWEEGICDTSQYFAI